MLRSTGPNHAHHNDYSTCKTSMQQSKCIQYNNNHNVALTLNIHDSAAAFPAVSLTLKSTAMSPSGNPDAG